AGRRTVSGDPGGPRARSRVRPGRADAPPLIVHSRQITHAEPSAMPYHPPTGLSVERPHASTVPSAAAASRYAVNSELPGVFRPRDAPSFYDEQVLDEGG